MTRTKTKRKKRPPAFDIDPALLETLVRILATVDSAFAPIREFNTSSSLQAAAYQSRASYPSGGVHWYGGSGKAAADRKTHERAVAELRDLKLVEGVKPSSRTTRVRMTDLGEAVARASAGLPPLEAGRQTVERVAELIEDYRAERRKARVAARLEHYVPETALAGIPWGGGKTRLFVVVEEMALPALVRGWMRWGCDCHMHVCYAVTPAGRQALADGFEDDPPDDLVPESAECRTAYYDEFRNARSRLESAALDPPGEIGEIPLGASCVADLHDVYSDLYATEALS